MSEQNKMTKMTLTCRKCIQEQQYEPLEFTASVEVTFTEADTRETIQQNIGAARRTLINEINASFDAYFAKQDKLREEAVCRG